MPGSRSWSSSTRCCSRSTRCTKARPRAGGFGAAPTASGCAAATPASPCDGPWPRGPPGLPGVEVPAAPTPSPSSATATDLRAAASLEGSGHRDPCRRRHRRSPCLGGGGLRRPPGATGRATRSSATSPLCHAPPRTHGRAFADAAMSGTVRIVDPTAPRVPCGASTCAGWTQPAAGARAACAPSTRLLPGSVADATPALSPAVAAAPRAERATIGATAGTANAGDAARRRWPLNAIDFASEATRPWCAQAPSASRHRSS